MISQNTIQITNVIQLSTAYLNRFFSKVGVIEKLVKDQKKKLVFIEFKNNDSIDKAMKFNGRILDKKPIFIQKQSALNQKHQKSKQKRDHKQIRKVPCLHEFKNLDYKIQIRSEYRLVEHSDVEDNQIHFLNNPLEGMRDKAYLWKVILHEITRSVENIDIGNRQIIFSASMGIWALMQLKFSQIRHIILHNQNEKSKYIEKFIQEVVINKLTLLRNSKIINTAHRYKASLNQNLIDFGFNIEYPEQTQQEAKLLCKSNQKMYNFLYMIYSYSELLGKIYHELHTNSLILFQNKPLMQKILFKFNDKFQTSLPNHNIQNSGQSDEKSQVKDRKQTSANQKNLMSKNCFSGWIQNYGSYIFQSLNPFKKYNTMIWLQTKNNKISKKFPYPGFFYCNLLFQGSKLRNLVEQNFFNLYRVDQTQNKLIQQETLTLSDKIMVFEEGQFSIEQVIEFSLSNLKFQFRKIYSQKQKLNEGRKTNQNAQQNQFHSIIFLNSQSQLGIQKTQPKLTGQFQQQKRINFSFEIIFVGIHLKQHQKQFLQAFKLIKQNTHVLSKEYSNLYQSSFQIQKIQVSFSLVEILPEKQGQCKKFNRFKCESYLINYIDTHIIARNSIIVSQEFAGKLAQKILQQTHGHKIYGFSDKKYVGSQIWRLYNKSGVRRAKHKIEQCSIYKKVKTQ